MSASPLSLKRALNPLEQRLQGRKALRVLWLTLSFGLILTCLFLIAGRLRALVSQDYLLLGGLGLTLFLVIVGQFIVWFKPPTLLTLARLGDKHLHLDERLVTALELVEGRLQTSRTLHQAQVGDTLTRLQSISVKDVLPLTERRNLLFACSTLLVLTVTAASLYLVQNPLEQIVEQQNELAELLEQEIVELEQIQTDLLAEADPVNAQQVEELSDTLTDLITDLKLAQEANSPEEAMAALSEAKETLTQLDEQKTTEAEALENMAEAFANSGLEEAQTAAEAMEQGNYQEAAEALNNLAENAATDPGEADDLAEALNQAAESVAESNPELAESLQQAAQAAQAGDNAALNEALEQAAQELGEAGAQAQNLEELSQTLENIEEARESLAQQGEGQGVTRELGEGQGQGEGQGEGEGEGESQGQSQGQGQGQGNGSGREDPGPGADGLYSEQGTNGVISTDNGPNENRTRDYSSIYAPDHIGGEGGPIAAPPEQNPDTGGYNIGETGPNPDRPPGEANVPYTEVYRDYADQANTALEGDYVPLNMKDYVRQYFGALEPE